MTEEQYQVFLADPPQSAERYSIREVRITLDKGPSPADHRDDFPPSVMCYTMEQSIRRVYLRTETRAEGGKSLVVANNSAVTADETNSGKEVQKNAYYLHWSEGKTYAMEIADGAELFFTAQLTGCGLIFLKIPDGMIVLHHNIQVPAFEQNCIQKLFESKSAKAKRDDEHTKSVSTNVLYDLVSEILEKRPDIMAGKMLSAAHYAEPARVFGVRRGGRWYMYINHRVAGTFKTELLFS